MKDLLKEIPKMDECERYRLNMELLELCREALPNFDEYLSLVGGKGKINLSGIIVMNEGDIPNAPRHYYMTTFSARQDPKQKTGRNGLPLCKFTIEKGKEIEAAMVKFYGELMCIPHSLERKN